MKTTIAVMLLAAGCAAGIPYEAKPLPDVPAEELSRGATVYFGSTYRLQGGGTEPLFVYERRVDSSGAEPVATHVTREPSGAVAIADQARHSSDYQLRGYTLFTDQLGRSGGIEVEGDEVRFRLNAEGQLRTASERKTAPVVVGPTLIGFMYARLDSLRAGAVLPVRFAVLDRLETLGFELRAVEAPAGQTRVKMSASSPLVALLVDPVFFTFEAASGKLQRIEGRVPPKVREGDRWAELDARVEYRFVAQSYR